MNGREVQTFHGVVPWSSSDGPLLVGAQRDDGVFFNGDVSDVRVYRRGLNSKEIEALSQLDTADTAQAQNHSCRSGSTH